MNDYNFEMDLVSASEHLLIFSYLIHISHKE